MSMPIGWVCPKCGRGNAPWKGTCDCGPQFIEWPSTITWPFNDPPPKTSYPIPPPTYTTCESKDKEE